MYFGYRFERCSKEHKIEVECTCHSLIEEFICFPLFLQQEFWLHIASKVPVPGNEELIQIVEGRRGGWVVRLSSEDDQTIRLLLTH